jgi:hypothetical protein
VIRMVLEEFPHRATRRPTSSSRTARRSCRLSCPGPQALFDGDRGPNTGGMGRIRAKPIDHTRRGSARTRRNRPPGAGRYEGRRQSVTADFFMSA